MGRVCPFNLLISSKLRFISLPISNTFAVECYDFSGFAFIRPTAASIRLYETAWQLYLKYHRAHDQAYMNSAINRLNGESKRAAVVQIQSLSRNMFPCGIYYFEHEHRAFENKPACPECVMVHNNYLGSIAAKVLCTFVCVVH